ncbi:MAG: DUF4347 domain-containing protein [Gloeomargarita sp. SKYB31]|nr:DUF4347 domain-containing protein [Gloeomargarita sp. SKYB31]
MKRVQLGWLAGLLVAFAGASAQANPIVPANDGVGSVVNRVGNQFDITGGTRAGSNLFHSLLKFGLSEQQIANFLSQPTIRNILTRVTGGETSVINGLIKVTGGPSNLYLLNPAGLVFGPNAQLDIPGSFYGTTANAIKVGNGWFGLNTSPSELQRLTGEPSGFAFSSGNQVLNGELAGIIKNEGKLSVPGGERVVLAGGIVVNTGTIETPHGQIVVTASPGGRYVEITPAGSALSFRLPVADDQALAADNLRPLRLEDIARLATGSVQVGGTLTTASGVVNPNSRIELVGENVKLVRGVTIGTEGTEGLTYVRVQPLVPVNGWVFVERFPNFEDVVNSLAPGYQLVLMNRADSGVEKVNQALSGQAGLKSLHIVSGGNQAQIWFGRDFITPESLERYAAQIAQWGQYLDKDGGIYFYACNLAETAAGKGLVDRISQLTGRAVSASVDITGSASYQGNWLLEYGPGGPSPFDVRSIDDADVKLVILTVTKDGNNDLAYDPTTNPRLRPAINAAGNGDTVRLSFSSPASILLGDVQLTVAKDITIDVAPGSAGVTILQPLLANARVFEIAPNRNVTIDGGTIGITIRGGRGVPQGGGIFVNSGAKLTLQGQVAVKDNSAQEGGGIATRGTLILRDSAAVSSNSATRGGGIFVESGAVATLQDRVRVSTNEARDGGGLYIAEGAKVTLQDDVQVDLNGARGGLFAKNGGGIYTEGVLIAQGRSQIRNSFTSSFGAGIFATPSSTVILQGNSQVTQNGFDGQGRTTVSRGGGAYIQGKLILQEQAQISANGALEQGGGIFIDKGGAVTLQNSTKVAENRTFGGGSGIFVDRGGTLTLKDEAEVVGNGAGFSFGEVRGGGIFTLGKVFIEGSAQVRGNFASSGSLADGGGIFAGTGSTVSIRDRSVVTGNSAIISTASNVARGGGISVSEGSELVLQDEVRIDGNESFSNFSGAKTKGGGIFVSGNLTLKGSVQVTGNISGGGRVSSQGGGIFVDAGGNVTLQDNVKVSGNITTSDSNLEINQGGGIFVESGGKATLRGNAQIVGNKAISKDPLASTEAGGIYVNSNSVTIQDAVQISGNTAKYGGGIFVGPGITLIIGGDVRLVENTAQERGGGGGIFVGPQANLVLQDRVKVEANRGSDKGTSAGGGLFLNQGIAQVRGNVQFSGNNATYGGGIYLRDGSQLLISDNALLSGNKAVDGGGLYTDIASTTRFESSARVENNVVTGSGGGIVAWNGGKVLLQGSVLVANNTAASGGAGILVGGDSGLTIQDNVQVTNNKGQFGGGIFAYSFNNKGPVVLLQGNAQLSGNQAKDGGGMYADGGQTKVTLQNNVQVFGNRATGGGGGIVVWNKSTVTLLESVQVVKNVAQYGGGIFRLGGNLNVSLTTGTISGNIPDQINP